uniref:Amine oxidase n=2 Tax=Attheya septentrionalis TaxID=420275 RepID=A0A7S2XTZ3_9STRA|mmetsp:Transcript_8920/g.16233  ORF Transcript_8920/g.16233 Transcript_8920/m.16233 type:complete len:757 (+) Transcript_8920:84-2354(+)
MMLVRNAIVPKRMAFASSRLRSVLTPMSRTDSFATVQQHMFHHSSPREQSLLIKAAPITAYRAGSFFSTMPAPTIKCHPLDPLTASEIKSTASAVKKTLDDDNIRFVAISLKEPRKVDLLAHDNNQSTNESLERRAEVIVLNPSTGIASELTVCLNNEAGAVVESHTELRSGVQPMLTPDDCDLAEAIAKASPEVQAAVRERYGITDVETQLVCDPWSVHLASPEDELLTFNPTTSKPQRLVQTFLYQRMQGSFEDKEDNHYAHPIDITPVVDLNSQTCLRIDGMDRPPPKIPTASVNYHRNLLHTNSYLETVWRTDTVRKLDVVQPDGPSFEVTGNEVEWQGWTFRVGFNYREGLVLHNLKYRNRKVVHRASLVEMAVPYGDPHPPFQRKCAFDVGDYGLGYCANSLELGCDCLGHIYYFDTTLSNAAGEPVEKKKVVCMHEEDAGLLWKHVEYRNGHSESRRARELIISSIATVVNYEYLFYWRLKQDGTIDFEIKLSGELSTNLLSAEEEKTGKSTYGTIVARGVNAQIHQHMFCARLDMAVDGDINTVSEVDVVASGSHNNPYGNAFGPVETTLTTESGASRTYDATKARSWKISNAEGKTNPVNDKPVAYKLIPFSRGGSHPTLLTSPESAVSKKGAFANYHLFVTPHSDTERFPAGEYTPQGNGSNGLPDWMAANRSIESKDVVLWHSFGVTHMPRVEDFPVMPCETTGFMLKPDGFFAGNPAIDLPPDNNKASKLAHSPSEKSCCDTTK